MDNTRPPNTLPAFIGYFRQLATAHVDLQGFVHGAAGRIIAGARHELAYPLLWLETPTLTLADKDGTAPFGQRASAFVVLASSPANDYDAQDAVWAQTEAIALDVLSKLRDDCKKRVHRFLLDGGKLEAVATLTVAGEIGWRFEFELGDFVPLPYQPARWAPAVPPLP